MLLVDDNEVSRYVLREKLSEWDFQIFEARGGREALAMIDRESPDLIFLDLLMPDMGGLQVLEELRASDRDPRHSGNHSQLEDAGQQGRASDPRTDARNLSQAFLNETFAIQRLHELLVKANVVPLARMQRHA